MQLIQSRTHLKPVIAGMMESLTTTLTAQRRVVCSPYCINLNLACIWKKGLHCNVQLTCNIMPLISHSLVIVNQAREPLRSGARNLFPSCQEFLISFPGLLGLRTPDSLLTLSDGGALCNLARPSTNTKANFLQWRQLRLNFWRPSLKTWYFRFDSSH